MKFNQFYFLSLLVVGFHMFIFQIKKLDIKNSNNCLKIFKSNNLLGLIILLSLLIGKF